MNTVSITWLGPFPTTAVTLYGETVEVSYGQTLEVSPTVAASMLAGDGSWWSVTAPAVVPSLGSSQLGAISLG